MTRSNGKPGHNGPILTEHVAILSAQGNENVIIQKTLKLVVLVKQDKPNSLSRYAKKVCFFTFLC